VTLNEYVLKRNGVPMGAAGSLSRNLRNAFGADSPKKFWKYWNPIWGYYLASYVYLPLKNYLPAGLAVFITFAVSGALHDLAIGLLGRGWQGFITLWFLLMGLVVVVSGALGVRYAGLSFVGRVAMNGGHLAICFVLAVLCRDWLLVSSAG